jgi:hypothetical protein
MLLYKYINSKLKVNFRLDTMLKPKLVVTNLVNINYVCIHINKRELVQLAVLDTRIKS